MSPPGCTMPFFARARFFFCALLIPAALLALVPQANSVTKKTGTAMWDLSDLYPSPDAWSAEYARVKTEVQRLESWRGTLGTSAVSMLDALDAIATANRDANRLYTYAALKADEDLGNSGNQERKQQAGA